MRPASLPVVAVTFTSLHGRYLAVLHFEGGNDNAGWGTQHKDAPTEIIWGESKTVRCIQPSYVSVSVLYFSVALNSHLISDLLIGFAYARYDSSKAQCRAAFLPLRSRQCPHNAL